MTGSKDSKTKTVTMDAVVVHAGGRSFMGMTPLSRDTFDSRCSTGRTVELYGAFELCRMSTTDNDEMHNLVSMSSVDHLYGAANKQRVKPSSWYFVDEQGSLNSRIYLGLYGDTTRRQAERTQSLVSSLEDAQKEAEAETPESEETAQNITGE